MIILEKMSPDSHKGSADLYLDVSEEDKADNLLFSPRGRKAF